MPVNNHLLSVRLGYIRFHVLSFCYFLINNRLFRAYILIFFLLHLCHLSPPPSWFPIKFCPTFLRLNRSFTNSSIANVWFLRSYSHLRVSEHVQIDWNPWHKSWSSARGALWRLFGFLLVCLFSFLPFLNIHKISTYKAKTPRDANMAYVKDFLKDT